jgi:predicted HicB family RNase H-like nuclease
MKKFKNMDTIVYKGYVGSVKYSSEDEVFWGKVEHINDLITFESDNAHELKRAFSEAVDDYLSFCSEKGVSPEKPFKGSFNIRLRPSIHKMAFIKALEKGISLNKYIESVVEKSISLEK